MTTDVTTSTGTFRVPSDISVKNRVPSNVVPINSNVSEQLGIAKKPVETVEVNQAASRVNDFVKQIGRNLEFSVHESSGRVIITVRESETGKIIRQIPPEELLVIADLVRENLQSTTAPPGILLADKV